MALRLLLGLLNKLPSTPPKRTKRGGPCFSQSYNEVIIKFWACCVFGRGVQEATEDGVRLKNTLYDCYYSVAVVSDPEITSTVAHQAPWSMGFHRQGYWSGLLFPSPEDLPDPGIKPVSPPLAGRFFTIREASGKHSLWNTDYEAWINYYEYEWYWYTSET